MPYRKNKRKTREKPRVLVYRITSKVYGIDIIYMGNRYHYFAYKRKRLDGKLDWYVYDEDYNYITTITTSPENRFFKQQLKSYIYNKPEEFV